MIVGPDSKYKMMWMGEWRPVVNMLDHSNTPTTLAVRVAKVVLFIAPDGWVASLAGPADLIERTDRDPNAREWDPVDH